jgi:predicted Rossmann-fold nucleotide-binding protein
MKHYPYIDVSRIEDLPSPSVGTKLVVHYAFQYIDFNLVPEYAEQVNFVDCVFMGCELIPGMEERLGANLILPRMGMIYHVFNSSLYHAESLYEGFDPARPETFSGCFDSRVYADYLERGKKSADLRVTIARSLHDHSMSDALQDFLSRYNAHDVVGIMGGHFLKRTDERYRQVVMTSKVLTEKGKLMVSGGGPGAMEATHLGAWMAGRTKEETEDAIAMLASAPSYQDPGWLSTAFHVREKYSQTRFRSLGIPTWLYGHEPATPFATHIAKFFENSIREDSILSIAQGGIIFFPGSAGTLQEVFQDAAQNHYLTCGVASPMVFVGKDFYTREVPVYPLLQSFVEQGYYKNLLLSITDSAKEAIESILSFA